MLKENKNTEPNRRCNFLTSWVLELSTYLIQSFNWLGFSYKTTQEGKSMQTYDFS